MTLNEFPPTDNIEVPALTDDPPFEATVRRDDGRPVVTVIGELDLATAPSFAITLSEAAESEGDVVVDIGRLTFLCSSGLSVLVAQHKALKALGRNLIIRDPTPMARRLFEITGLAPVLSIQPEEPHLYGRN
jgi:anti-anti-sigma factor